jgi:glutamate--cysteine ligase
MTSLFSSAWTRCPTSGCWASAAASRKKACALPGGGLAAHAPSGCAGLGPDAPHITTDYSESQLELITGVHAGVQECLDELTRIHQFTYRVLRDAGRRNAVGVQHALRSADRRDDSAGRYGSSNVGRAKSVYRMGLGHRYGRRMQTISGIHYNWSMPGWTMTSSISA